MIPLHLDLLFQLSPPPRPCLPLLWVCPPEGRQHHQWLHPWKMGGRVHMDLTWTGCGLEYVIHKNEVPVEQDEVWEEREGNWLSWGLHLHSSSGPCESQKPLTSLTSLPCLNPLAPWLSESFFWSLFTALFMHACSGENSQLVHSVIGQTPSCLSHLSLLSCPSSPLF